MTAAMTMDGQWTEDSEELSLHGGDAGEGDGL